MSDQPTGCGPDLARQALATARAEAKKQGLTGTQPKKRTTRRTITRGSGRDPQPLGGILGQLAVTEGWDTSLGAGDLTDRWATICPTTYADRTQPAGYDPNTGTLTIRTASQAVATGLRWAQPQFIAHLNTELGRTVVRRLNVVVGAGHGLAADPEPAAPRRETPAPVRTRADGCAGYQAALEAAQAHRPGPRHANPYVLEAMARQEAALRANRPALEDHREAQWATADEPRPVDASEASRRAALARKRAEATGTAPATQTDLRPAA